jgi:hypothetical protein
MSLSSEKVMEKVNSLLENKEPEEQKAKTEPTVEPTEPKEPNPSEVTAATEDKKPEEPKAPEAEPEKNDTGKAPETQTSTEEDLKQTDPNPSSQHSEDEKKHNFDKQQQTEHAFKRERAKRKAAEAKYQKAVKELEELKKQKVEYNADNPSEYINHQVDLKTLERQKDEIYDELSSSMSAEYEEINNRRISACFPDEGSQAKFRQVIDTEGPKLLKTLDEFDPDQAVLAYLDDSDLSPILTSVLIQKPQYLEEVLSKRSKYGKYLAMQDLENRIKLAQKQLSEEKKKTEETQQPSPQKKPLPIVGSQTKSEANKDTKEVFDPNAFLRKLNEGSKRYHTNGRNLSK